MINNQPL